MQPAAGSARIQLRRRSLSRHCKRSTFEPVTYFTDERFFEVTPKRCNLKVIYEDGDVATGDTSLAERHYRVSSNGMTFAGLLEDASPNSVYGPTCVHCSAYATEQYIKLQRYEGGDIATTTNEC